MLTIENDILQVEIKLKGAELCKVFHKKNNLDYLWNGNPDVWGKFAPNLFPAISQTYNDTYFVKGQSYQMPRHGFAKDFMFIIENQYKNSCELSLVSNEDTEKLFPFKFKFIIGYELDGNNLKQYYKVINLDNKDFAFAVGAHPAFKCPLIESLKFEDYYLYFNDKPAIVERHELAPPLRNGKKVKIHEYKDATLNLERSLFDNDSLLIDAQNINTITLANKGTDFKVQVDFADFPLVCLWTKQEDRATYICIEPFYGAADDINGSCELFDKFSVFKLAAQSTKVFNINFKFI